MEKQIFCVGIALEVQLLGVGEVLKSRNLM